MNSGLDVGVPNAMPPDPHNMIVACIVLVFLGWMLKLCKDALNLQDLRVARQQGRVSERRYLACQLRHDSRRSRTYRHSSCMLTVWRRTSARFPLFLDHTWRSSSEHNVTYRRRRCHV